MLKVYLIISIIFCICLLSYGQHHHHHHQILDDNSEPYVFTHGKTARSIIDSHPNGSARRCDHEKDILKWLPKDYSLEDEEGHYHLLLAASDHQLPILINWLAIAFVLGYLPSPRLRLHFHCDGVATRRFVEKHLLQVCEPPPKRKLKKRGESQWRRIIQDRLGTTLDLVQRLDETDYGAMTFDLDAPWIRNMITVFDYFSHGHNNNNDNHHYDFIAMGTMMEGKYNHSVITNFGAVFFKQSVASKLLAERAWWRLNSDWVAPYPDQDYVTAALFEGTNITQYVIPELADIANDYKKDEICAKFPSTCHLLVTGAQGEYTMSNTTGKYMFLPQVVAPRECHRICSSATTLLQHCGIAYCLPNLLQVSKTKSSSSSNNDNNNNLKCSEIPEYILKDGSIINMVNRDLPHHGFRHAPPDVFDTRTQQHMISQVTHFIDSNRILMFCKAYPKICSSTPWPRGGIFNITVHNKVNSVGRRKYRKKYMKVI